MTTKSLQDDNTTDLDKLIEDFENYELGHRIATDNRRAEFIKSIKHLILKARIEEVSESTSAAPGEKVKHYATGLSSRCNCGDLFMTDEDLNLHVLGRFKENT